MSKENPQNIWDLPIFGWAWKGDARDVESQPPLFGPADATWMAHHEIVMTDDQLAEREEWVEVLMASQDYPSDDQFELELDYLESIDAF